MIYIDFEHEKMSNRNLLWTENSKDDFCLPNGDIERENFRWTNFERNTLPVPTYHTQEPLDSFCEHSVKKEKEKGSD